MTEKFGGEVGRKYAKIDLSGRKAIEQDEVVEHSGFPESLRDRMNASLLFDPDSEDIIRATILDQVEQLEKQLGIEFIIAGRDYPIHSTLLEGLYERQPDKNETDSDEARGRIFTSLERDKSISEALNELIGRQLNYKYLLLDKGNLLLTATEIPEDILKARDSLAEKYKAAGLKPLYMANILHLSLSRIAKLPEDEGGRKRALAEYKQELIKMRHRVSSDPLKLTVRNFNRSSSFSLLTKENDGN